MAFFQVVSNGLRVDYGWRPSEGARLLYLWTDPPVLTEGEKIGYLWLYFREPAPLNRQFLVLRGRIFAPGIVLSTEGEASFSGKECRMVVDWDTPGLTANVFY